RPSAHAMAERAHPAGRHHDHRDHALGLPRVRAAGARGGVADARGLQGVVRGRDADRPDADAGARPARLDGPWRGAGVPRRDRDAGRDRRSAMILLLVAFAILLVIGLPIALAMLGASLLVILTEGIPLSVVAQRVVTGVQSFPLLAIPLFTLAGSLMNDSGISERLFAFTRAFVGHIRGGMAHTAIVGNVFLSGISGSSVADCAATSRVFVPQLSRAGYSPGFAAALCASCATLGPIIPPSILMVIYAWQANISLGD